jgi:hypothetical protein
MSNAYIKFIGFITLCIIYLLLNNVTVMCWNDCLTVLFPHVPKITYWQAYGLWWLSSIFIHGGIQVHGTKD